MFFREPMAEEADRLTQGLDLCAPTLLPYELANIARTKCRRTPELTNEFLAVLDRALTMNVGLYEVPHAGVCRLALETGLSAYDASYLYLARALSIPLVTFDEQLARAAAGRG